MAAEATIAILRADADDALSTSLRHALQGMRNSPWGQLRIEEMHCARPESISEACRRTRSDLAILIEPAEYLFFTHSPAEGSKNARPHCPLLVVLPESLAPKAPELLNSGVSDFVILPIRPSDLLPRVLHLLRPSQSEEELIAQLKRAAGSRPIIGQSPILMTQLRKIPTFASCDGTVLITGETGTGKELCARAIHYCSRRSGKPFIAVNCGAIPTDLLENELFGHERGAYTTALTAQPGLVQESDGGSLFLDEIDSLATPTQSKLLRFLQEKEYRPVGSSKPRHVDVRVIAASNIELAEAVHTGRFRKDLYYRLNVLSLRMPPLRDRRDDIPFLAQHFLQKYALEFSRPARSITAEAVNRLLNYPWPGNARELENIIEYAVLVCDVPLINAADIELPDYEPDNATLSFQQRKDSMVAKWEHEELKKLLMAHRGNVNAAAKREGKDPGAFRALLRKHHLRPTRESPHWNLKA